MIFKQYMALIGKGSLTVVDYMDAVLLLFHFNRAIQYGCLSLLVFQVCLFVLLFVYIIVEKRRRRGGLHQV